MEYTYKLREDVIFDEDNTTHTVYGIDFFENGEKAKTVPDIFTDKRSAEELIRLCNFYKLSPLHLMDVIEDAII